MGGASGVDEGTSRPCAEVADHRALRLDQRLVGVEDQVGVVDDEGDGRCVAIAHVLLNPGKVFEDAATGLSGKRIVLSRGRRLIENLHRLAVPELQPQRGAEGGEDVRVGDGSAFLAGASAEGHALARRLVTDVHPIDVVSDALVGQDRVAGHVARQREDLALVGVAQLDDFAVPLCDFAHVRLSLYGGCGGFVFDHAN